MFPQIWVAIVTFLGLSAIYIIHEIIAFQYQAVQFAWQDVTSLESKKNNQIPVMQKIANQSIVLEQRILPELIEARKAMDLISLQGIDTNNIIDAEMKMKKLIGKASYCLGTVPHIAMSKPYEQMMHDLAMLQDEIDVVLKDYNKVVAKYNKIIGFFPFSAVNFVLNRKPKIALYKAIDPFDESLLSVVS